MFYHLWKHYSMITIVLITVGHFRPGKNCGLLCHSFNDTLRKSGHLLLYLYLTHLIVGFNLNYNTVFLTLTTHITCDQNGFGVK